MVDKILRRPLFLLSSAHFLANYVPNCPTVTKLRTILQLHCRLSIANLLFFKSLFNKKVDLRSLWGLHHPSPLLPTGKVRPVRVLEKVKICPRSIVLLLLLVDVLFS